MFTELVSVLNGNLKSARIRESGGAGLEELSLKNYSIIEASGAMQETNGFRKCDK